MSASPPLVPPGVPVRGVRSASEREALLLMSAGRMYLWLVEEGRVVLGVGSWPGVVHWMLGAVQVHEGGVGLPQTGAGRAGYLLTSVGWLWWALCQLLYQTCSSILRS